MDEIDGLLRTAGERWRASLPPAPAFDGAQLLRRGPMGLGGLRFVALAGTAALVVAVIGLSFPPGRWLGAGGPLAPTTGAAPTPTDGGSGVPESCTVTRPSSAFSPPAPYPETPPPASGSAWFGSPALWTMVRLDGEIWADLPHGPGGWTQKTFWWSEAWSPAAEPEPSIAVRGTRLDGPGEFAARPGTNALGDAGEAMLVAVDLPAPGCWRISAQYRDAVLSYVAWVSGD